jgi:hypothetical protein
MSGAFWIALAVRANTVARGVQLANQLRKQVDFPISFSFVRSVADRDPYVFGHWPKILTQNSKWVS